MPLVAVTVAVPLILQFTAVVLVLLDRTIVFVPTLTVSVCSPKPSYTIDTLTYLKEQNPDEDFVLIMGGDNLGSFHKWKNYEVVLKNHQIYVYKRPNYDLGELQTHPSVKLIEAPQMEISSSMMDPVF